MTASLLVSLSAVAQEEPAVEAPAPVEEAPPADAPAEEAPAEVPAPPEAVPEEEDPGAARSSRRSYDQDGSGNVAESTQPSDELPRFQMPIDRPYVRLKVKDGREVEGSLLSETPEGYLLLLPTGETRFFDRLDVVADHTGKTGPSMLQKALLGFSLAWPGVGQVVYGFAVQQGTLFTRSSLVVGVVLIGVAVLALTVMAGGAAAGLALPKNILGGSPLNPVSVGGAAALGLTFLVAALDAGARILLD